MNYFNLLDRQCKQLNFSFDGYDYRWNHNIHIQTNTVERRLLAGLITSHDSDFPNMDWYNNSSDLYSDPRFELLDLRDLIDFLKIHGTYLSRKNYDLHFIKNRFRELFSFTFKTNWNAYYNSFRTHPEFHQLMEWT